MVYNESTVKLWNVESLVSRRAPKDFSLFITEQEVAMNILNKIDSVFTPSPRLKMDYAFSVGTPAIEFAMLFLEQTEHLDLGKIVNGANVERPISHEAAFLINFKDFLWFSWLSEENFAF